MSCLFSAVQESTCPVGDEEEAGGGSFAVHSERRDPDCGSGSGQTSLGKGLQQGETSNRGHLLCPLFTFNQFKPTMTQKQCIGCAFADCDHQFTPALNVLALCCLFSQWFPPFQLLDWHLQLDRSLPAPLDTVGAWLHEAEGALRQEIVVQQAHDVTAKTVHRALEQHKVGLEGCNTENTFVLSVCCSVFSCFMSFQDVLKSLKSHQQVFQRIHKDRSVDGVPVPPDQLQDMAERWERHTHQSLSWKSGNYIMSDSFVNFVFFRINFVSTSSSVHLAKMEFLENKHNMQAFLSLAETKLKSWIIKYGRQESVELMLEDYVVSSDSLTTSRSAEILIISSELLCKVIVCLESLILG